MNQFESYPHKASLAFADGRSLPTLNRYNDIHLEIIVYYGVWKTENLDQTGKEDVFIPSLTQFTQDTTPKHKMSHKCFGIDCL